MSQLSIKNVGPIRDAEIIFGDLTVFVGPQASGKSIALQWFKLLADAGSIKKQLLEYGTDWVGSSVEFLNLYFGEGMASTWLPESSSVKWNKTEIDLNRLAKRKEKSIDETVFMVPAQRVLTLRDGWPRPFGDYGNGDPYAVRNYSERLRFLMESEFKIGEPLFPKPNRLKSEYRKMLTDSIFGGFSLGMVRSNSQKRLVLQEAGTDLPYMVWSAGQREFVPLLLGLYWLMPPSKVAKRGSYQWVIIEELEMGLHPKAITTVLLLVLELIARGYRVCLSTHSPQILDMVWAWQALQKAGLDSESALLDLLGARHSQPLRAMAKKVLAKQSKVYYFEAGKSTLDISSLDPDSVISAEATWGGLGDFAGRANDIVAEAVADRSRVREVTDEL